jgi:type IV secretory pathway TrbL component
MLRNAMTIGSGAIPLPQQHGVSKACTDLFSAKPKTPTYVAYKPAIALVALLPMIVAICQIIVSARHCVGPKFTLVYHSAQWV